MTFDAQVLVGFRSALRDGLARDLDRARRRRRRVRRVTLAAVAAGALALVLAQPFGRGESAIARARAALDLPSVGILHVTSRGADGHVGEEVWQSLSNPSEHRRLEADEQDAGGPHEDAISAGVWMRYDAVTDTIYTQRVIEAVGSFSEVVNLPDLRRSLALAGSRDLGVVEHAGRRLRAIALPPSYGTTCTYYADAGSFLPVQLVCLQDGKSVGSTDYAVLPDTAANRANFSLLSVHPGATVMQDPAGIPGSAGDDLSAVTAPGIEDAAAGHDELGRTDEASMRSAREQEVAFNTALEGCFADHGAYRVPLENAGEGFTFHDPTGTVGAICHHFEDDGNAIRDTPAGKALQAREVARAQAVNRCIEQAHPIAVERPAVTQTCTGESPDAFLDGLPTYH
jgi:hypothetical protein